MEGKPAAYGNETLYKVAAVTVIPPQKKATSDEKNNRFKRETNKSDNAFEQLLDEECKKTQNADISYKAKGYTRNAMPFYTVVQMRDYTFL